MKLLKVMLLTFCLFLPGGGVVAQTFQPAVLGNFNYTNGAYPYGGMVLGDNGNLYGTTYEGGTNNAEGLFRVTADGGLFPLYAFSSLASNGSHYTNVMGADPYAGLTAGNDGNLYGVNSSGGTNASGTIFKLTPNGAVTLVFTFDLKSAAGTNVTGVNPEGKLALGLDGSFYGTAYTGGPNGKGNIFKVTTNGLFTNLASFSGTNGEGSSGGLTLANDGNFYGITYNGGAHANGTLFRVATNGTLASLYSFSTGAVTANFSYTNADGANPDGGLVLGNDGNLFGMTHDGGTNGHGTIFKVTTNGLLTTLLQFDGTNGSGPLSALTLGKDGNLYGVTPGGGTNGTGIIFKVTTVGAFTSLCLFNPAVNNGSGVNTNDTGIYPYAALTLGSDGNFYGTTTGGGNSGNGTPHRLGDFPDQHDLLRPVALRFDDQLPGSESGSDARAASPQRGED